MWPFWRPRRACPDGAGYRIDHERSKALGGRTYTKGELVQEVTAFLADLPPDARLHFEDYDGRRTAWLCAKWERRAVEVEEPIG